VRHRLDITGDDPSNQHGSGGGAMSPREVLLGTIEEYARHLGHADLLRADRRAFRPATEFGLLSALTAA
jgi:Protein of unknown function (DUF664)